MKVNLEIIKVILIIFYFIFLGFFKNDMKNGCGKLTMADGSSFEGLFQNDNITGSGCYVYKDKRSIKGEWMHNKLIKKHKFL